MPGQLGPTSRDLDWLLRACITCVEGFSFQKYHRSNESTNLDLIRLWDTLCNANNQPDLVLNRFEDSIGRSGRWHIKNSSIWVCFPHGLRSKWCQRLSKLYNKLLTSFTVPKTGSPRCVWPAFLGEVPPTILVPYARASFTWKVPCRQHRSASSAKRHPVDIQSFR